ncbi:hypothetical protein [Massilia sp. BSC265]|uniref:hypothetical protein n=1 Tax=Massilia sp. BSC265 TaxID=1549812 RepID=UPI000B234D56|nr:hypothetical protein [Massilia sp. BSC265]
MSQTVAIVFPLPVVIALVALLLVLLAWSAVVLSLRAQVEIHFPPGEQGARPALDDPDGLQAAQS